MAKKLKEWPQGRVMRGAYSKYPWEEWMDGNIWMLKQGEDFFADMRSMRVMCYNTAKKFDLRVNTTVVDERTLVIKAVDSIG